MMRYLHLSLLAVTSVVIYGCALKLCDEGEISCIYGKLANCQGEDCQCDPQNDENCIEVIAKGYYASKCQMAMCLEDVWQNQKSCDNGFDGHDCIPDCRMGDVKCTNSNGLETLANTGESCILRTCDANGYWSESTKNCDNGFDGRDCIPECRMGDVVCLDDSGTMVKPDENTKCYLKRCMDGQWPDVAEETCSFGFNDTGCIDPCLIDGVRYDSLAGSSSQMVSNLFKCYTSSGWDIDNTCTNDFSYDVPDSANRISVPDWAYSDNLKKIASKPDTTGLMPGKCGECNSDNSPVFCTKDEDKYYIHQCENGKIQIDEDFNKVCTGFESNICKDSYGQFIFVDHHTNRYHCGQCDLACSSSQVCANGVCTSKVTKDSCVDGYATFQSGARIVRAYCIDSLDDLKKIGTRYPDDNYDNAYILVNDQDFVLEDWMPIGDVKKPFRGMLFGNGKTIKVKRYHGDNSSTVEAAYYDLSVGLLSYIDNAYVEDIRFEYIGDDQEEIVLRPHSNGSFVLWGMLAGQAKHSVIRNVRLDFKKDLVFRGLPDDNSYWFNAIGGLVGAGDDVDVYDVVLNHLHLNNPISIGTDQTGGLFGSFKNGTMSKIEANDVHVEGVSQVAAVSGSAEKSAFDNIQLNHLTVFGIEEVGGFLGNSSNNTIQNVVMNHVTMNSEDADVLDSDPEKLGGMIGKSSQSSVSNVQIEDVNLYGTETMGGMIGASSNDMLSDCILKNVVLTPSGMDHGYYGGLTGTAENDTMNRVQLSDVLVDSPLGSGNAYMGGLAGSISNSDVKNVDIAGTQLTGSEEIGGLAGELNGTDILHVYVMNQSLVGDSIIGGMVGHLTGTAQIVASVVESAQVRGGEFVGNYIGYINNAPSLVIEACSAYGLISINYENYRGIGGLIGGYQNRDVEIYNLTSVHNIEHKNYPFNNSHKPYSFAGSLEVGFMEVFVDGILSLAYDNTTPYPLDKYTGVSGTYIEGSNYIYDKYSDFEFSTKICTTSEAYCYSENCVKNSCGKNLDTEPHPLYKNVNCDVAKFVSLLCEKSEDTDCKDTILSKLEIPTIPEDPTKFILPAPVHVENRIESVIKPSFCEEIPDSSGQ